MTSSPEKPEPSSGPEEPLLKFRVPHLQEVEVVVVKLLDGRVVARTAEELKEGGPPGRR